MQSTAAMFRFFTSPAQPTSPERDSNAPAQQTDLIERPSSPRLQLTYAQKLEETVAVLRADLSAQKTHYENLLSSTTASSQTKLTETRAAYDARIERLNSRVTYLEDEVAELRESNRRLGRRKEELEAAARERDEAMTALEGERFELQRDNGGLREERARLKSRLQGERTRREKATRLFTEAQEALRVDDDDNDDEQDDDERFEDTSDEPSAPKLLRQSTSRSSLNRQGAEREKGRRGSKPQQSRRQDKSTNTTATPRAQTSTTSPADDGDLYTGETLRGVPSHESREPPQQNQHPQDQQHQVTSTTPGPRLSNVDPRSLDALRTLGASRNASPTPQPPSQRKKTGASARGNRGADKESSLLPMINFNARAVDMTPRHGRKRARVDSDGDGDSAATG
ncbi:hypothetical protein IWX90DRAFT_126736 [Phyllosticta citrichinensis]|uniref:Uncharacterized protein n=1 Tax=Phyllosticta citrichinensis TaxID=1130410 RepID=A0ABR1Y4M8_9PEZI